MMHGYEITHLDKYKRSKNTSVVYAFQLDGVARIRETKELFFYTLLANNRFDFFRSHIVPHLDPPLLHALGNQVFCDSLDVFSLHRNLLQLRVTWIRLHGCRRRACLPKSLSESVCAEAENFKTGYVRYLMIIATDGADRNRVWCAFSG